MKVLSVVGNRPQFVKSGPLSVALRGHGIGEVVVHTGQHYDRELSDVFFKELELPPPAYSLDLQTADVERLAPAVAEAVDAERPDWVLVYGDTNSTLAGARAAGRTPVAHVEAGLRSGDLTMPEEHNRIEVDRISSLLFTPDERSKDVLEGEGVQGRIDVVGDVMADANMRLAPLARERSLILEELGLDAGEGRLGPQRQLHVRGALVVDGEDALAEDVPLGVADAGGEVDEGACRHFRGPAEMIHRLLLGVGLLAGK